MLQDFNAPETVFEAAMLRLGLQHHLRTLLALPDDRGRNAAPAPAWAGGQRGNATALAPATTVFPQRKACAIKGLGPCQRNLASGFSYC